MRKPVIATITTVIVPCGGAKIWDKRPHIGPVMAQHAYRSSYFTVNRQYAEAFGTRWLILSAKHGFLMPTQLVFRNYDATFKRKGEHVEDGLLKRQAEGLWTGKNERIIVLGGKDYVAAVRRAFSGMPEAQIETPFLGLSMLEQMREIKRAIAAKEATH